MGNLARVMDKKVLASLFAQSVEASSVRVPFRNSRRDLNLYGLVQLDRWFPEGESDFNKSNGAPFQVLDFFSGCGAMSSGFRAVSEDHPFFEIVGGCDISQVSVNTFSKNFGVPATVGDVREFAAKPNLLNSYLQSLPKYSNSRPTILIGCAPCQGFTTHRKKHWDKADHRNSLIENFATIAAHIKPACIIMENVPELLSKKYWEHFLAAKDTLESSGYVVKQTIYNTADFGVPQDRYRALVVAMPHEFELPEPLFGPTQHRSVRTAIGDLPEVDAGVPHPNDALHRSAAHRPSTLDTIRAVPKNGGSRPAGVGPKCLDKTNGFSDVYGRLRWDKPAITITHYARNPASGRFVHPEQDRGLTLREAARLQSFPDTYELTGSFDDMFRQVGEAVPPAFSVGVAVSVLVELTDPLGKSQEGVGTQLTVDKPVSSSYSSVIVGLKAARDRACNLQP
jgi:DNA (cytosine-5)-methyltransferase 1